MGQFTKKKYFIGIDISKDHLDVALLNAEELEVFKDKKVDNSFTGFDAIQNWLLKHLKFYPNTLKPNPEVR